MRNRVLADVPTPSAQGLRELRDAARSVARKLDHTHQMSYDSFCSTYSGRKKSRYKAAVESLIAKPLNVRTESHVTAFVKAEKLNPHAKVNPDPRMIQARTGRFNVEYGRFLKPIEHQLYLLKSKRDLPLLGKGLDYVRRGENLVRKMKCFSHPVVYSIDASRFDQHVNIEVLRIVHSIYEHCNGDRVFKHMMQQTLRNRVRTYGGFRYKTEGRRMSGDMDTALGNCLIMIIMVIAFAKRVGLRNYEMFVDGDDTLIIVDESDEGMLETMSECFLDYGQELKLEGRATAYQDVVWCQTKCCLIEGVYRMVPDWKKCLSVSCAGTRYWHEKNWQSMARAVGLCHLSVNPGVPIIQPFAEKLISLSTTINRDIYESDLMFRVRTVCKDIELAKPTEIKIDSRIEFARVYSIPVEQQLQIEEDIRSWTTVDTIDQSPCEIAYGWLLEPRLGSAPATL